MQDKRQPGTFNWDHAAYWAEISISDLPDRAKHLLRLLFDKFKRLKTTQLDFSVADCVKELFSHLGIQTQESTVRRALTNLTACNIIEVRQNTGRKSTWILRERNLWKLTCRTVGLSEATEKLDRIDQRIGELQAELFELQKLRASLGGLKAPLSTPFNHVQPTPTTFNRIDSEDEMPQSQNRLRFNEHEEGLPPPPPPTTFNRMHACNAMDASLDTSTNKTSIALHPSGGARGGWGVHLGEEEVKDRLNARSIFKKFVDAGLLEFDRETELRFFAFLATAADLDRSRKIRKTRAAYISGAIRGGYWHNKINQNNFGKATALQKYFDDQERQEAATAFSDSMPGLGDHFHGYKVSPET